MKNIKEVEIAALRVDGDTQPRERIDEETVEAYAEVLRDEGGALPPLEAVHDGTYFWLTDGFHRWHAAQRAGRKTLPVKVVRGTQEDARWLCLAANKEHDVSGRRRTNADKRRAVGLALSRRPKLSDGAIAEHVGVSRQMVTNVRAEATSNGCQSPSERTGRDGRTTDTTNIGGKGKGKSPKSEPEEPDESDNEEVAANLANGFCTTDEVEEEAAALQDEEDGGGDQATSGSGQYHWLPKAREGLRLLSRWLPEELYERHRPALERINTDLQGVTGA